MKTIKINLSKNQRNLILLILATVIFLLIEIIYGPIKINSSDKSFKSQALQKQREAFENYKK